MVLSAEDAGRALSYVSVCCVLLSFPLKKFRHEKCVEITETTGYFRWAENRAGLLPLSERQNQRVGSGCEQGQANPSSH